MTVKLAKADARLFRTERKAFLKLCEAIDTPRSLTCFLLAKNDEYHQYLALSINEDHYNDVDSFRDDYLVTEMLTKNPRLPLGIDTESVALSKFLESEEICRATNRRFRQVKLGELPEGPQEVKYILHRARRIIRRILGELTSEDLASVWDRARFGPGATSDVVGQAVALSEKYSTLGATPRLRDLWKLLPQQWLEAASYQIGNVVHASRVTTVLKNAKTKRTICIEPHLNIYVQLGVGGLLRSRLRRSGLDLSSQEMNRFLASVAESWGLATLDLSSASDLIAEAIVEWLIPARWLHLLRMARTEYTTLPDGTTVGLEKWSSMGNGYTFELETLIFWALAKASSSPSAITTSYGDDIICPQEAVPQLVSALEYCGFRVNRTKSCLGGSFFESCGTDWFKGMSVRPIYFRAEVETLEDVTDATLLYANQLRRWAYQRNGGSPFTGCDARLLKVWLSLRDDVPQRWRLFIPDGTGDGGLIGNFDEAVPKWSKDCQAYTYRARVRPAFERRPRNRTGYYASRLHKPLRAPTTRDPKQPEWLRRVRNAQSRTSITSNRNGRIIVSDAFFLEGVRGSLGSPHEAAGPAYGWPDLGPWC